MADESDTQELPTQSTAEEVRDDGHPDTTQPTEHGALAPSVGEQRCCTDPAEWHPVSPLHDINVMDEKLRPIRCHLEYLLNKADEYQAHLIHRRDRLQVEGLCRVVPTFLKSCHPFFSYLEHTARSCLPHRPPLPLYIRTQLLQFSQQLCSRLEELILTYASYNFLTLEETNPLSISHFFIGHCQVNHIKLSIYRYCCPAPFQPSPSCRLFKLMRWNVERERGIEREDDERERGGRKNSTEYVFLAERCIGHLLVWRSLYVANDSPPFTSCGPVSTNHDLPFPSYFLCYEEVTREGEWAGQEESRSEREEERRSEGERGEERRRSVSGGRERIKMWSIGQWAQMYPNPQTDDIYEWILCGIPRGQYQQLFQLGATEPSTCSATDCLLEALLSYDSQTRPQQHDYNNQ